MPNMEAPAPAGSACPVCGTRGHDAALFCSRCGAYVKGDGKSPQSLNFPLVHLLSEIAQLQRDLLRQFRQGHALQARQFERALQAQAQQLEKTLAHGSRQAEQSEERIQFWQRLTAGLAALVFVVLVGVQLAG